MRLVLLIAMMAAPIAAAVYAHYRLPFQTPNSTQLWITRLLLISVGMGFGWAMSRVYLDVEGGEAIAAFIGAFGVAHIPAAIILFLKKQRSKQLHEDR